MKDELDSAEQLAYNLWKRITRSPLKTILLLAFLGIVIVIASFISGVGNNFASRFFRTFRSEQSADRFRSEQNTASSTIYASQTIENSPGAIQIQGDGNTIVTNRELEPKLTYGIRKANELREDGKYHAEIRVDIVYFKDGFLDISQKLQCILQSHTFDPIPENNHHFDFDCTSAEPMIENEGYFVYRRK